MSIQSPAPDTSALTYCLISGRDFPAIPPLPPSPAVSLLDFSVAHASVSGSPLSTSLSFKACLECGLLRDSVPPAQPGSAPPARVLLLDAHCASVPPVSLPPLADEQLLKVTGFVFVSRDACYMQVTQKSDGRKKRMGG